MVRGERAAKRAVQAAPWALGFVAVMFALYVLSFAPVWWGFCYETRRGVPSRCRDIEPAIRLVYLPVVALDRTPLRAPLHWWAALWD